MCRCSVAAEDGGKDLSKVDQGEVVILPAVGASVQEMLLLSERRVPIVDTTCPWVRCVWLGGWAAPDSEEQSIGGQS